MKCLFLYSELADYFLRSCEELSKHCEVHIIRWPVNPEAPFRFQIPAGISVYEKSGLTRAQLNELVDSISPDVICCSGWVDKDYLYVTRKRAGKIPTVLICDTSWRGKPRQFLALLAGRLYLRRIFSHTWVPGESQARYVRKLGFKGDRIRKGYYCCDLPRFNGIYERSAAAKEKNFPHRFIYAGRYYRFKGITELWHAFTGLNSSEVKDWELWCLGTGSVEPVRHPAVKHFGFVQPADLEPILKQSGVFILPSHFEPWGVVVQEFAAAGFPLLLSKEVGAGEAFLSEEANGASYAAGDAAGIKAVLKKIINLSDKELFLMAERSHELAQRISLEQWAGTLINIQRGF